MVRPLVRPLALSCLALALGAGAALADTVTLKNGREIHGKLVEERKDEIVMKIEGGLLPIPKRDIATFTENENFGRYGGRPRAGDVAPPAPPAPARPGDKPGAGGEPAPGEPAPGARPPKAPPGALTKEGWTWAAGVPEAKVEELTPVRDKLLEELEKLGPTAKERLEKATPNAEERADIAQFIQQFALRNRRANAQSGRGRVGGNRAIIRGNARESLVEHGAKALEQLKQALTGDNLNTRRYSAETLKEIAPGGEGEDRKDVQWLMYHHDIPGALLTLFDFQDDMMAPFFRKEAHETLAAVTGHDKIAYPESTEAMRTPEETQAMRDWQQYWQRERARWTKAEKDKDEQRKVLTEKLEKVRAGQAPE